MQVLGAYHKRKSVEKVDPEMPKRKVSDNSRSQSKRKHRTEYKSIDSPEVELKGYKRKNLSILNELQSKHVADKLSRKAQSINLTEKSKILTEHSVIKHSEIRKTQNGSVNSAKDSKVSKHQQTISTNIDSRQVTSRFAISHEDHDEASLTSLINQNKTSDSNPLINTARLRDQQGVQINPFQFKDTKKQENTPIGNFNDILSINQANPSGQTEIVLSAEIENNQNPENPITINPQRIDQNAVQDEDDRQNNDAQNFDDYQFGGGKNSIQNQLDQEQSFENSTSRKNQKKRNKKIMPPPAVQSYTLDALIRSKPQNWRQNNRYIPETEQENRMTHQRLLRDKQSMQLKRQQQEIMKMVQEYQQNKNSINLVSQRKIETNKIMQKIYRDKRISKQSLSLPQLKPYSLPKKQIIVSETNTVNIEGYTMQNPVSIEEKFKVNNTIAKSFRKDKKNSISQHLKGSLSYSKLGFGSSEPRLLNEEELKESEIQSIEKIQKKLRQKGISFDANSVRKGLLNVRDVPIYKISSKANIDQGQNDEGRLDLPQKQLLSNGFYKIFPL